MIQLAFQPAFDPYHAIFRYFEMKERLSWPSKVDKYRIIDFYLCFPEELLDFRFLRTHGHLRKAATRIAAGGRFEAKPSSNLLLSRMKPVQLAALETLEVEGFLLSGSIDTGLLKPTDLQPSDKILAKVKARREADADLLEILGTLSEEYGVLGPNGLKARSGLLEYRYDAI